MWCYWQSYLKPTYQTKICNTVRHNARPYPLKLSCKTLFSVYVPQSFQKQASWPAHPNPGYTENCS